MEYDHICDPQINKHDIWVPLPLEKEEPSVSPFKLTYMFSFFIIIIIYRALGSSVVTEMKKIDIIPALVEFIV